MRCYEREKFGWDLQLKLDWQQGKGLMLTRGKMLTIQDSDQEQETHPVMQPQRMIQEAKVCPYSFSLWKERGPLERNEEWTAEKEWAVTDQTLTFAIDFSAQVWGSEEILEIPNFEDSSSAVRPPSGL